MTCGNRSDDQDLPDARTAPSPIESLTDALATEGRLIEELITVMRRQRTAIDSDNFQLVADSVFATHRVLLTLSEARRRRRALNTLIGQHEDLGIHALDDALGQRMTPGLRAARDGLYDAARVLSCEVALNRRLLREARARSSTDADPGTRGGSAQEPRLAAVSGRRRGAP